MGIFRILLVLTFAVSTCLGVQAQTPQHRIALVIGQGAYPAGGLPTAVNDAGLIAQALNDSGFEIVEGRDLDLTGLRSLIQEFLARVEKSGPETAVAVYISGYAAQLEGDNYLLPVDARIARESDIPMAGFRLSDLIRSLNAGTRGARIVVIDAPRAFPSLQDKQVAAGLALLEPSPGMLIAYASAPGNVLPDAGPASDSGSGDYGIYAQALAGQIYEPGLEADELFKRLRLQVHEMTAGVQIPWHEYRLEGPFFFSEGAASPKAAARPAEIATPEEAYSIAIETDTITGYQNFLKLYPDHPLAKRVKVLLANRREAVFWNRTVNKGTAEAYWTYLKSYPKGPHAADTRRRLEMMARPVYPPDDFPVVIYRDVPMPIEIETIYEPTYIYGDYREYYSYAPPPPPPVYLLPPIRHIPWRPPVRPEGPGFLPMPPRPPMLPPHAWKDRPVPPRVAPVAPMIPGREGMKKERPVSDSVGRPGWPKGGPGGLPRPPRPGDMRPTEPGQRPQVPPPSGIERPQPVKRPAIPAQQGRPKPMDRPAIPIQQERPKPMDRPAVPVQQERPKPMDRPAVPVQQERPRPMDRPAVPVQQERPKPMDRPAVPLQQERPRPMDRPAVPVQQERPKPMDRPAVPVQQERPRPMDRPAAPVQQERPRQMERAPAPAMERPAPAMRPAPPAARPQPADPDRKRRLEDRQ